LAFTSFTVYQFDNKFYKQTDACLAKGSPIQYHWTSGPLMADVIMNHVIELTKQFISLVEAI